VRLDAEPAVAPAVGAEVDFFELTDPGRTPPNGDAVGHWPTADGVVFAVADGMGERESGGVASGLALDAVARELASAPATWDVPKRLRRAVQAANLDVYAKALAVPELRRMTATLTASAVVGATLHVAHVGNCRLFLRRDRQLVQLTKDHPFGWEAGTRALGIGAVIAIDAVTLALREDDVLLQCSDGLHGALGEGELEELLAAHPPAAACRAMVRRARQEGIEDDVSVQVAAVTRCPRAAHAWWPWRPETRGVLRW